MRARLLWPHLRRMCRRLGHEYEPRMRALRERASGTVGSIFILLGMIAGLALILGIAAKLWKGFPLKHLLRCSVQPMRILITYSQVTTQLGDVLNFAYPGIFGDVLDFLKPILDICKSLFLCDFSSSVANLTPLYTCRGIAVHGLGAVHAHDSNAGGGHLEEIIGVLVGATHTGTRVGRLTVFSF